MKCDSCAYFRYFPARSWWAVIEGYEEMYGDAVCLKGYWSGEWPLDEKADPWKDCKDYKPIKNKIRGQKA